MKVPDKSRSMARVVDILLELHRHGTVSRGELMEKFNITERTVYRDLNALSPIVEHTGTGQYQLIQKIQSSAGKTLHHSLSDFLNADIFFPERGADFWQFLDERAAEGHIKILHNDAEHSVKSDIRRHLNGIEKAIKKCHICQIVYTGKSRKIQPYRLINKRNIWYLLAADNGKLKSFSLSQISWLDISKEIFLRDDAITRMLEDNPDPWVTNESFEVRISVNSEIARYFRRRNLLPMQTIVHDTPSGMTLTCRAAHEKEILPLILYWIPNIQILEPDWLSKKLHTMLSHYLTDKKNAGDGQRQSLHTAKSTITNKES